jgi:alkylation response protein AidB-like acyl-CoA dehydrogenase
MLRAAGPGIDWLEPPSAQTRAQAAAMRETARSVLAEELRAGGFVPRCDAWQSGWDPAFSRRLAARGLVGMILPPEYGGGGRTALERLAASVELLAAGAPVAAHWFTDRQTAPCLLRFGTEKQKLDLLPRIARGELYFALGLSEPDSGSDLASLRTGAVRVDGGWRLNGRKIWTSGGHRAHACTVLCRTSREEHRNAGLSQLIVAMDAPGVQARPIRLMDGEEHFSEILFEDVFVPDEAVLGEVGEGWRQVTSELAFERSGPERFLSTYPLLRAVTDHLAGTDVSTRIAARLGELYADLHTLWLMSWGVAEQLQQGTAPAVEAAIVKDLGTAFESRLFEAVREITAEVDRPPAVDALLAQAILHSPGYAIRGGTSQILRGIVARELLAGGPDRTRR